MPCNIVLTTAEDIISVVDAVLAKERECTKEFISEFADISLVQAENALKMAIELDFIRESPTDCYCSQSYLARLLVSSRNCEHKAAILRLALEQYNPYIMFKLRYAQNGSLDTTAKQIRLLFSITSTYKDIKSTLVSIATYAKSMLNDGAGSYNFNDDNVTYIEILDLILRYKSNDDRALQLQLGQELFTYLDYVNVITPLSEAYSKIQTDDLDFRTIILYSGNAFESFLQQIATENGIALSGRNGISQKADALLNVISKKHRGMVGYVAQIRNAADHGADPDENDLTWQISEETALMYPLIIVSLIKGIYSYQHGVIKV
jgi:hypothetical protein